MQTATCEPLPPLHVPAQRPASFFTIAEVPPEHDSEIISSPAGQTIASPVECSTVSLGPAPASPLSPLSPLSPFGPGRPLRTGRTNRTRGADRTLGTGRTGRTDRSLRPRRTGGALLTLEATREQQARRSK